MTNSSHPRRLMALRLKSMAETTSLYSEPVWRLIWDEVLPRPHHSEPYVFEEHGTLIALWYISVELHQGFYPNLEKIHLAVALAPGVGNSFSEAASAPTVHKILDQIVNTTRAGKNSPAVDNFGWLKTNRAEGGTFIRPANSTAMNNIVAIVNTAIDVGKWIRSEQFLGEIESRLDKRDAPDEKEYLAYCDRVLNDYGYKRGRIVKIANRIRRDLQRFGFDGTPEGRMKVVQGRALDEPPYNFRARDWPTPEKLESFPTMTCDEEHLQLLLEKTPAIEA